MSLIIPLTGRPPVSIEEWEWQVIASVSDKWCDNNQYEDQATRTSRWSFCVREHFDGRSIISATYSYNTSWSGERDLVSQVGVLSRRGDDVCSAIKNMAKEIASRPHYKDDHLRWQELEDELMANLPPEKI